MVAAMASKSFVAQWMPVSISGEGEADDASALQFVVGAFHGDHAHPACGGKFADRGQWLAGCPVACHHAGGDLIDDLLVHRPGITGRKEQFRTHWHRCCVCLTYTTCTVVVVSANQHVCAPFHVALC